MNMSHSFRSPKSMDFDAYDEPLEKEVNENPSYGSDPFTDHAVWSFIQFDSPTKKIKKSCSINKNNPYDSNGTVRHLQIKHDEILDHRPGKKGYLSDILKYFRTRTKLTYKIQELKSKSPTVCCTGERLKSRDRLYQSKEVSCDSISPTTTSCSTLSLSDDDNDDDSFWNGSDRICRTKYKLNDLSMRYSRRSEIPSHGVMQTMPMLDNSRLSSNPNQSHLRVSYWAEINKRPYMEDRFIVDGIDKLCSRSVRPCYKKCIDVIECATVFAVFDGHAGALASQYCADFFSSYLCSAPFFYEDVPLALKIAFKTLDKDFISTGNDDGTTACVAVVIGRKKIVCANAGDSRAIVVRSDGSVASLSFDHKPNSPGEAKRIHELGGRVIHMGMGTWRVEGRLAVSRSIGDASLKPYVSANPDIVEYSIGPTDLFVVIASDGIWDVLDNTDVVRLTISNACNVRNDVLAVDSIKLQSAARRLSEYAKLKGSRDNISSMIIDLQN